MVPTADPADGGSMQTTMDTNGRRTAATWVAATGAFLLVAAAGVFVSVRWDDIPDAAKLGILLAVTGAAIFGGAALRRTLPATGEVLFHLGAFLLPIDLAAVSVRTDMTWGELLLAQGLLTGLGFGVLAARTDSIVLRWSSIAGTVLLAGGIGAVTDVPAPLALVVFAAIAAALDDRASMWWAAIAGLSPALGGVVQVVLDGSNRIIGGTLANLGFDASARFRTAWLVGGVAAAILARAAQRRGDVALGFLAIAAALLGVSTTVASQDTSPAFLDITIAGGFLAIELIALTLRRDPFWSRPLAIVATIGEVFSVPVIALCTATGILFYGFMDSDPQPFVSSGISLGIVAAAWFAADLRRQPGSGVGVPLGLLRGGGRVIPNLLYAATTVGAVAVATMGAPEVPVSLTAAALAAFFVLGGRPATHVVVAAAVGLALVVAPHAVALVLPAVFVSAWASVRRRDPALAAVAAFGFDVFALDVLDQLDVSLPFAGLALCITAIVWSGLAAVVDDEWRQPFFAAAGVAVLIGVPLAGGDPVAFADALIVTGGIVAAAAIVAKQESVAHFGGAVVTLGVIGHLSAATVVATEPYVLPVAVHLALAGYVRRRVVATSSWLAYVPSIVLLGGSALAERLSGGAEWHALVAAVVGTSAVAIGGWQRLAGPLLVGTGLLVAITAHESLGALAGVPTWTWLAVAGTTLLGTGVALERSDTSPVDAGRRLVDVIGERFE